jgi:hypothetical protein
LPGIDGTDLYGGLRRYSDPIFIARAEQDGMEDLSLREYLEMEMWRAGGTRDELAPALPLLLEHISSPVDASLSDFAHGDILLAQIALSSVAPVRLALLDGHLSYLDARRCEAAARLLRLGLTDGTRFIVLTASHLAGGFSAGFSRHVLSGRLPVEVTELAQGASADAGLAEVRTAAGVLRVFGPQMDQGLSVESCPQFEVLSRLSGGVRIVPSGTIDEALVELRRQGLAVERVEWERI